MIVKVFPAFNGDFILIKNRIGDKMHNIIIDGGTPKTYAISFSEQIKLFQQSGENIDLLVITHIDDDHIGGIVNYFSDESSDKKLLKEAWFNSGKMLIDHFGGEIDPKRRVKIIPKGAISMSVPQGQSLEAALEKLAIWKHPLLISGHQEIIGGVTLQVLSPNLGALEMLNKKWETEKSDTISMSSNKHDDFHIDIKNLVIRDFKQDAAVPNGSSIAFLATAGKRKALFLADSHPSTVIASLEDLKYSRDKKLKLDMVKVSHHASKGNTSTELLEMIDCKRFVVSTDGSKHGLPDKEAIARIIHQFPNCTIYFNYKNEITQSIFTEQDKLDYPNFDVCYLSDTNYIMPF